MAPPITRRSAILGAGALASAFGLQSAAAAKQTKPNILFILADDLGYADLSCYGRQEYTTKNIDRLAKEGMRFTQAYANSAVCSATRTALITGRYQDRLDVGLDEPNGRRANVGLSPDHPTLPSLLKHAGYSTALVGKWHLGGPPKFGPLLSGYDHFYGIYGGAADYFNHDASLIDEAELAHDPGYLTTQLGARTAALIESMSAQASPFFISLHFTAPHWPWEGPNDQAEAERVKTSPSGILDFDGGSQATFAKMVMAMDGEIGRVLATLEKSGRLDNTIIIFTSDNGGERYSDTWPFTGKKGELLEGGIRIPAIVRWPGQIGAGTTSDQVSMSMDWLPTLTAAAGTRPDRHYPSDGVNLLKVLTGKSKATPRKVFWRYNSLGQQAVRDGDMKYLKILDNTFLFNVVDDPLERANLKDRKSDVFKRLAADWQVWNKTMLPYGPENTSSTASGEELADHFGAPGGTVSKLPRPAN